MHTYTHKTYSYTCIIVIINQHIDNQPSGGRRRTRLPPAAAAPPCCKHLLTAAIVNVFNVFTCMYVSISEFSDLIRYELVVYVRKPQHSPYLL
jgi:hypothetical protein